jgi:hypothetical protein
MRYVKRTHLADTIARTYELVARELDESTPKLHQTVGDKSAQNVVAPRRVNAIKRREELSLRTSSVAELSEHLTA